MAKTLLSIDTSDAQDLMNGLSRAYDERTFQQLMYRVMQRAGTRTRTLVKKLVPADYHAPGGWVGSAVGAPEIQTSAGGAGCIIPVDGARGKIGRGGPFKASASGAGGGKVRSAYEGRKGSRTRRAYKINAQIVKAGGSALPSAGDRPHIMIMGRAGHVGGVYVVRKDLGTYMATVHRRTKTKGIRTYKAKKTVIVSAVGIGVPQMPMTRSADKIQLGISQLLYERMEHEHEALLRRYVGKHMS